MIISTNRMPTTEQFERLCRKMCSLMNDKASREPDYFLSKGAQKLEPEVKKALDDAAQGTPFAGTIEIVSGQRFPDIVAAKYFGVEVKSTKYDKWTMVGGSVAEGTRVDCVEHIFILFGKLYKPVQFKTRRYEECLYDIAVTHSPRYKIDMNLPQGETIFDKMGITYNDLRSLSNPLEPVTAHFRASLKPGESLWWVNAESDASSAVPFKIRMWKSLSKKECNNLIVQGFALFPELFSNKQNRYERFTLWLVVNHAVVSASIRDLFSAGGQSDLDIKGNHYENLPKKYLQLFTYSKRVQHTILNLDEEVLISSWNIEAKSINNRIQKWTELVAANAEKEQFSVIELLENMFTI